MRNALSVVRVLSAALGCALAALLASVAGAQTIDVGLKLFYSDPMDPDSGGAWQVIAKSSPQPTTFGIQLLSLKLAGIDPVVEFEAPRAQFNGTNGAGFSILANTAQTEHRAVVLSQQPRPAGETQGIFYGVGTRTNGHPGDVGPPPPTLTSPLHIPWAPEPDPPGDLFTEAAWDTAATFASGTFAMGVTPAFFSGTSGQVFASLGTATSYGSLALATITTEVRDNLVPPMPMIDPDYNDNGVIDAADYVLWRKHNGLGSGATNAQGDSDGDGDVDAVDYDNWRAGFGSAFPGAGGGAGSLHAAGVATPEPTSGLLLLTLAGLLAGTRTPRPGAARRPQIARLHDQTDAAGG